jgi:cytochrome c oxidase subunit 2
VPAKSRDQRRSPPKRRLVALLLVASTFALAGCGKQSIISDKSPQAHGITLLWWWMLGASAVVFLGAVGLLAIAWFTRGKPGLPFFGQREGISESMVLVFGVAIPAVTLIALFGASDVYLVGQTSSPNPRTTAMTIDVIGHQWWWEVRYPGTTAVTANEIHIPVDTRVNVVATTADVIHSFWVPQLNRKIDMIPGLSNRILLYSNRTGAFRGQCSQFCGFQHAHMAMWVFVQTKAAFRSWLATMAVPARAPTMALARAGERDFLADGCASCHQLRGTGATATVGPDLTHVASRTTLAGATIPNTPRELAAWIHDPQTIKPGDRMPDLGLSWAQVYELVAYLDGLK